MDHGDHRKGDNLSVYGFKCPVHAAILTDWSKRYGIDWSIPPDEQADRPPGLPFLQPLDRTLAWLPLGAQYVVAARKPG